jgi:glycosyltransferase involved in cell wall biosynthesis
MNSSQEQEKTISIIMCAYNEEATVGVVLEKLRSLDYADEIVVVDNGSTDNTYHIIKESQKKDNRIKIVKVERNRGLGYGLRKAIKNTTCDVVARQDADLEYDPFELYNLVEQILNGNANVVYGSRILVKKAHKVHYYFNYLANVFITFLNNFVTNLFLSDVATAAKAFDGELLRSLKLTSNGFEIEIELTIKLKRMGCTFYEVPISYYGRTYQEGKKVFFFDGIKIVYYIFYFYIISFFMTK